MVTTPSTSRHGFHQWKKPTGLRFGVLVAFAAVVGTVGACAAAVECLCDRGPTDSRLNDAEMMVDSGQLLGLDAAQLEARFGKPNNELGVSRTVADQTWWLGKDDSCVDSRWLAVQFNDAGLVRSARIITD